MRTAILRIAAVAFVAAAPVAAAASTPAVEQIVAEAQKVREEAQEVKLLLKHKAADQAAVQQRLGVLETHARALKAAIADARATQASLTSKQVEALERAHSAAETLLVMLNNKAAILADVMRFEKDRNLLRAKAGAIEQRALLVEKQMERLRG